MKLYLRRLAAKVTGAFLGTLTALAVASQPFNVLTFNWVPALTVSGSVAALALLEGLAGRFTGDRNEPRILR